MKKFIIGLALLLTLSMISPIMAASKQMTITYYDWQLTEEPAGTLIRQVIKDFESENPDIKVVLQPVPTAQRGEKLITMLFGGQGPDVAHVNEGDLARLVKMNVVLPLDKYLRTNADLRTQIVPASYNVAKFNGKTYGIPRFAAINTLMYNKQQFADAGLDPNKPPATWAEFLDYAKKLTRDPSGNGQTSRWGYALLGAKTASVQHRYWSWLWTAGGDILNKTNDKCLLDSPAAIEAMKFYTDLALVHKVTLPGTADVDYPASTAAFIQEKAAMMCDGPWILSRIMQENPKLKVGVGPMPTLKGNVALTGGGGYLTITTQSKNTAAAWRLISYMMNAKQYTKYASGAMMPATRQDTLDQIARSNNPIMADFAKLLPYLKIPPLVPQMAQIGNLLAEEIQFVLIGQKTAEEASRSLAARANELLQ